MRKMHAGELRQLTGCRYPVLVRLERLVTQSLGGKRRGPPFGRPTRDIVVAALAKLRGGDGYRTLAVYLGIPHVTLQRYTLLVCSVLSRQLASLPAEARQWLLVDTTSTRVRSTSAAHYSGYKHHRCVKVQVVTTDGGMVLDVSGAYPGSVHDKTVWDREFQRVRGVLTLPALGDKAYAGARGEGSVLFRPIRRNEVRWKQDRETCRLANRALSRSRVRVEHAFARIKAFRVLSGQFQMGVNTYACVFRAVAFICNAHLTHA